MVDNNLIETLKSFNRKERYHLVKQILGLGEFRVGEGFKRMLKQCQFNLNIPENHFAAMDYHLDWIAASLISFYKPNSIYDNKKQLITANQEDVDFIICYLDNRIYHIVLIEAKLYARWSNSRMASKANRLKRIFGEEGNDWKGVVPHFMLVSPHPKPKNLKVDWPYWMLNNGEINWIELKVTENLQKVIRCNENGKPDKNGKCWKLENEHPNN